MKVILESENPVYFAEGKVSRGETVDLPEDAVAELERAGIVFKRVGGGGQKKPQDAEQPKPDNYKFGNVE